MLNVKAGDENGMPDEETLKAIEGYPLLRTDQNGWIHISTDGEGSVGGSGEKISHGLEDIYNFIPISETFGTSGQPTEAQMSEIAAAGYKVVVNLALPDIRQRAGRMRPPPSARWAWTITTSRWSGRRRSSPTSSSSFP